MGLGRAIRLVRPTDTPRNQAISICEEPAGSPPHIDFNMLYETFLLRWSNDPKKKKRRRGVFHPSSGLHEEMGLCKRDLIFDLLFAPMSLTRQPVRLVKALNAGTDRHLGLQRVFTEMALAKHMGIVDALHEVRCTHPVLPISGSIDTIAITYAGWRYALDYKYWSVDNCAKTFEPEWKHRVQLNTYMGLEGIKAGYVIYENKNTHGWLGPPNKFRVNFSRELFEEVENFCREIIVNWIADEKIPEYEEQVCKDNLLFCSYVGICEKERAGQVSWRNYDLRAPDVKRRHLKVIE